MGRTSVHISGFGLAAKEVGVGDNNFVANFYDLFRDTREEWPVSTEVGARDAFLFMMKTPGM